MKNLWQVKFLLLSSVVVLACGGWFWKAKVRTVPQESAVQAESAGNGAVVSGKKAAVQDISTAKVPQTGAVAASEPVGKGRRFRWLPQTRAAVEEYADLAGMIFPNPDEQMRKSELLMNSDYVRHIADYLLKAAGEDIESEIRDQSIDFLVEALKMGSTEAVTQVERVIADPQVENSALPLAQRKFLGETKGELLYQYAALNSIGGDGRIERQIAALMPGPVTKKIWNQVFQALESNFAESKRELAEIR